MAAQMPFGRVGHVFAPLAPSKRVFGPARSSIMSGMSSPRSQLGKAWCGPGRNELQHHYTSDTWATAESETTLAVNVGFPQFLPQISFLPPSLAIPPAIPPAQRKIRAPRRLRFHGANSHAQGTQGEGEGHEGKGGGEDARR